MAGQRRGNRLDSFSKGPTEAQANGQTQEQEPDTKKSDSKLSPEFMARIKGFLGETSFTVRSTTFTIGKMPALEGWQLLSRLVNALATTLDINALFETDQGKINQLKLFALLFIEVMKLPPENQEDALYGMLPYISVTSPSIQMARAVIPPGIQGDAAINFTEQAFNGLEAIDLYELLIRGLIVNFTPSSQRLVDVFSLFKNTRSSQRTQKDSTPSSPSL